MNIIELAKQVGGVADDQTIVLFHEELEAVARAIRAEREWVDLTEDEIANAMELPLDDITCVELEDARAVITAFKEKNK